MLMANATSERDEFLRSLATKKLSKGVVGIVGQMGMLMLENLPREDRRRSAAMLRDLADEIENWE
jgi:hypothetical protein